MVIPTIMLLFIGSSSVALHDSKVKIIIVISYWALLEFMK